MGRVVIILLLILAVAQGCRGRLPRVGDDQREGEGAGDGELDPCSSWRERGALHFACAFRQMLRDCPTATVMTLQDVRRTDPALFDGLTVDRLAKAFSQSGFSRPHRIIDVENYDRCIAEMRACSAAQVLLPRSTPSGDFPDFDDDSACVRAVDGALTLGESCADEGECQRRLTCRIDVGGGATCGECAESKTEGEPCGRSGGEFELCSPELLCDGACIERNLEVGAICNYPSSACRPGLDCVDDAADRLSRCRPVQPVMAGDVCVESCTFAVQSGSRSLRDIFEDSPTGWGTGLACVAGACVPQRLVSPGAACDNPLKSINVVDLCFDRTLNLCLDEDGDGRGVCTALPIEGRPCLVGSCIDGLQCVGDVCAPRPGAGEQCEISCAAGLVCCRDNRCHEIASEEGNCCNGDSSVCSGASRCSSSGFCESLTLICPE